MSALADGHCVTSRQSALPPPTVAITLMMLELKKVVRRQPGNWYERF